MPKKFKNGKIAISNFSMKMKLLFIIIFIILEVVSSLATAVKTISATRAEKYEKNENSIITASEQLMDMGIESAVSIAKSIYSNENLYNFLDKQYSSASEYYEAFYEFQQNTTIGFSNINIVKDCFIYTSNPTIMPGGNVKQLNSAVELSWYKKYQKIGKTIFLSNDIATGKLSLIRKLDYNRLETGDSFICLDFDMSTFSQYFKNLGFDGELFIISGGTLIFSNSDDIAFADDIHITSDYECISRNYYSIDIEYYSCEGKMNFVGHLLSNKLLLFFNFSFLALIAISYIIVSKDIKKRTLTVINEFKENGIVSTQENIKYGKDELGQIIAICIELSKRLNQNGNDVKMSNDTLFKVNSEYKKLFSTAMKLDAELTLRDKYPNSFSVVNDNEIALSDEVKIVKKLAEIHSVKFFAAVSDAEKLYVPSYAVAMICDDIFTNFRDVEMKISLIGRLLNISFESNDAPSQASILKLNAIFEDDNISDEYAFMRDYRYNPYLRLKHCFGGSAEIKIKEKNKLKLFIELKLKTEGCETNEN